MKIEKIRESCYGLSIFMLLKIDDVEYEISNYCGSDYHWDQYKTSADDNPQVRDMIIAAFKELCWGWK